MTEKFFVLQNLHVINKFFDFYALDIREQLGLSHMDVRVLMFLVNNPDMDTAGDIVKYRMFQKAHVSQSVESLIQKGYLIRERDKTDRRIVHLTVIKDLEYLQKLFSDLRDGFFCKLLDGFSDDEIALLKEFNTRLINNALNEME